MKISARLAYGFGAVLLMLAIISGVSLNGISNIDHELDVVISDKMPKTIQAHVVNDNVNTIARSLRNLIIFKDKEEHAKDLERIQSSRKLANDAIDKLQASVRSAEGKALLKAVTDARASYLSAQEQMLKLLGEDKQADAANYLSHDMRKAQNDFMHSIDALIEHQTKSMEDAGKKAAATASSARALIVAVSVIALVAGVIFVILIIRSITGPLNRMQAAITDVGKNSDFTRRVSVNSTDEVGLTAKSFNELMSTLQGTFGQLLESVAKVSNAAHSVSAASGQVAASSSSQSEAASAMAAAVEEMTVSINQVSDGAREALNVSRNSEQLSAEGGETIRQMAGEMSHMAETVRSTATSIEELGQHSDKISSIVQVIKDVADQTNLLALNAAIEAARAGEQGRGFAVVADEVRKLAERTTSATGEITAMIDAMQQSAKAAVNDMSSAVQQVDGGVTLANQAGSAIGQIKDGAVQVVGVVNDISSALVEQSTASNDIAKQVEKVANMTEENSAAATETASSANQLLALAETMESAVKRFKI